MSLSWILLVMMVLTVHAQQAYGEGNETESRNSRCQRLNTSARSVEELIYADCEIEDSDVWRQVCNDAKTLTEKAENFCILDHYSIRQSDCERATCMNSLLFNRCRISHPVFQRLCGPSTTRLQKIANLCPDTYDEKQSVCATGRTQEKVQIFCEDIQDTIDSSQYCGRHLSEEQLIDNRCSMQYRVVSDRLCEYKGVKSSKVDRCFCSDEFSESSQIHIVALGCAPGHAGEKCQHREANIIHTNALIGPTASGRRG